MVAPAHRRTNLVLIQSKAETEDDDGWNDTVGWTTHTLAWVSINPNRGMEETRKGTTQAVATHSIRGDWLDLKDVTPEMRIVFIESGVYPDPMPADNKNLPAGTRLFDVIFNMNDEDGHSDCLIKAEEKKFGHAS